MDDLSQKIYSEKSITLATFIGGPLAAGFLIGKNFKVFGNENAARNSVMLGLISTLVIMIVLFYFPFPLPMPFLFLNTNPYALLPVICASIIGVMVNKYQGDQIKEFLDHEGTVESRWKAFGYGVAGLACILVFMFFMVKSVSMKGYEKSVSINKSVVLHYSKEIHDSIPYKIAKTLQTNDFMGIHKKSDVFLSLENNTYKLKILTIERSVLTNTRLNVQLAGMENVLNDQIKPDKKIVIGFINWNMITEYALPHNSRSINPQSRILSKLKVFHVDHYHTVFYNNTMPVSDILKVGQSVKRLKSYFPQNQKIDIVFLNNGRDYSIKFFVMKDLWNDKATISELRESVTYFNDSGIGKKIRLMMVDAGTLEEKEI